MDQTKLTAYQTLNDLLKTSESATYEWTSRGLDAEWQGHVQAALRRLFGDNCAYLKDFKAIRYYPLVFSDVTPDSAWEDAYHAGMRRARALVRVAIKDAEDYELQDAPPGTPQISIRSKRSGGATASKKVFLVHGHDTEMLQTVARFVERLGLAAIVLAEQASGGATVIEKFELRSDVEFAVILLSPDDIGASAAAPQELKSRARQNVVLELGYFLGALGRDRICPIVRGRIELPSDVHGLVYVPFDADTWKIQLVRELKEAGFDIDANKAF